ncbi:MAG: serine kinase [Candidatus Hydrogenedentes bacterium]|nr:serine kinase [Candidatus Hydrogenedentota bacterium]
MKLKNIVETLGLELLTPEAPLDAAREIEAGYVSDLLSDVLAHGPEDGLLVTVQVHMNVIAVSVHAGLAGVIFAMGRRPEETVRAKAVEEGVALFASPEPAFDIAGRLYALGLRGRHA